MSSSVPDRSQSPAEVVAGLAEVEKEVGAPGATTGGPVEAAVTAPSLKVRVREVAAARLPQGSRGREIAKAGLTTYRETHELARRLKGVWSIPGVIEPGEPSYRHWLRAHRPGPQQLEAQRVRARTVTSPVSVAVVVLPSDGRREPGWNESAAVDRTIRSLQAQTWSHWTASIVGSPAAVGADTRLSAAAQHSGSIAAAANASVEQAEATLVVLLRAGDELTPDCFYEVCTATHRDPLVDLVTWDDDVRPMAEPIAAGTRALPQWLGARTRSGSPRDPRFRPSWSPEILLGCNYVGHAFAMRRSTFLQAGGLDDTAGEALVWDLLLRADLPAERVTRVTRILSGVPHRHLEPAADGARVVQRALDRKGWTARAEQAGETVRVRWTAADWPSVTVIIPTRHNRPMLETVLPSLARTDYPSFDVVIVDNGGRTPENEAWYAAREDGFSTSVLWWDRTPFNYSAVNNAAAREAKGDVLVFLNDDTEILDDQWMRELVGWARRPEIGLAGLQLIGPDGALQHAGVIVGMGGFADHVFEGMRPGSDSIYGSTGWYRNCLAVTGACVAVERDVFERLGGFDERFVLCGSDVALGLESVLRGLRNVCSPYAGLRHLESATRGTNVPVEDFFASYWRYNTWLFGGDPYWHPSLSLGSRRPALKGPHEPTPQQRVSVPLGRSFTAFRQRNDAAESRMLADMCRALPATVESNEALHAENREPFEVRTVNWYIPDIDSPFYGGINSALRIADHLARERGVRNRFVVWGSPPDHFVRSALAAAFPSLADSEIVFYDGSADSLAAVPEADVAIATLWVTAYAVAHATGVRRKFYLIQDFEPMFYPASTLYALAEESYRLGLYGLCNTHNMRKIYEEDYAGKGMSFMPAVDQSVFHAEGRHDRSPDAPVTVFVYARPGHWRNCWELASLALEELKRRLGDRVRIVTAGAWATGEGADDDIRHLGLLDYRATGELYRNSDVGLALTVSKHPSYLPLELMACGVPVVAFDNPWGHWILQDEQNCLLAKRTVDSLADQLERLCADKALRERLSARALQDIADRHSDWDAALAPIYGYLCDPEGKQD